MRPPATREDAPNRMICALDCDCGASSIPARNRRSARNDGAATQGSPVTFCDGRTFFASASGQTQLTADILAAVQVVRPRLAAGAPLGPRLRADSDSQP